jgi:taurine dioxygenase
MANTSAGGPIASRPVAPFGREVDLDLREPLTEVQADSLRALFFANDLLLFRNQAIDLPRQSEVIGLFGPTLRTRDCFGILSTDPDVGTGGTIDLLFHADYEYTGQGLLGLSLMAIDVVDGTSNTKFASTRLALQDMPAALRARIGTVRALMSGGLDEEIISVEPGCTPLRNTFPVVRSHPTTGAPYIAASEFQTVHFFGTPEAEDIRRELFAHLYQPAHVYDHVWNNGDLVIWDNRMLHHARGKLQQSGRRTLQRAAIGEKSIAELDSLGYVAYPKFAYRKRSGATPSPTQ